MFPVHRHVENIDSVQLIEKAKMNLFEASTTISILKSNQQTPKSDRKRKLKSQYCEIVPNKFPKLDHLSVVSDLEISRDDWAKKYGCQIWD